MTGIVEMMEVPPPPVQAPPPLLAFEEDGDEGQAAVRIGWHSHWRRKSRRRQPRRHCHPVFVSEPVHCPEGDAPPARTAGGTRSLA